MTLLLQGQSGPIPPKSVSNTVCLSTRLACLVAGCIRLPYCCPEPLAMSAHLPILLGRVQQGYKLGRLVQDGPQPASELAARVRHGARSRPDGAGVQPPSRPARRRARASGGGGGGAEWRRVCRSGGAGGWRAARAAGGRQLRREFGVRWGPLPLPALSDGAQCKVPGPLLKSALKLASET